MTAVDSRLDDFVDAHRRAGRLVVQPRMGFSDPRRMRAGLLAVRSAGLPAIGTLTLDSCSNRSFSIR